MDLLILLETSLDPVGNALGPLEVELHVNLAASTVAEVVKDLVLLRLGCLVIILLSAVPALFKGLEKLSVLTFSLLTHLISQIGFECLKLVHEPLLVIFIVASLGNLDLHGFTSLKNFDLLL